MPSSTFRPDFFGQHGHARTGLDPTLCEQQRSVTPVGAMTAFWIYCQRTLRLMGLSVLLFVVYNLPYIGHMVSTAASRFASQSPAPKPCSLSCPSPSTQAVPLAQLYLISTVPFSELHMPASLT